jgi:S1-C subfamily serine protease
VAITSDKRIYKMLKLTEDNVSETVFFSIEVNNFPVNQFAAKQDLQNGQTVVLTFNQWSQNESLKLLQIINQLVKDIKTKEDLIDSSEILNRKIIISEKQSNYLSGAPVLNTNGEVIGLLLEDNLVEPIIFIKPALDSLLSNQKIRRPYLGVHYIDLASAINLPYSLTQGKNQGALLYSEDAKKSAIMPKSLAQRVGLKEKDIILKFDDKIINQSNNLTEIIQSYKPGSMVDIVILRNKQEQTVKLELEELK